MTTFPSFIEIEIEKKRAFLPGKNPTFSRRYRIAGWGFKKADPDSDFDFDLDEKNRLTAEQSKSKENKNDPRT